MTIGIVQVDAFTTRPFTGNPAAVVLQPGDLTDQEMQSIATEMNLSETAFLLPATGAQADLRIRWFTPSVEVDLCGHATVATFHAALESGQLSEGTYRMECRSGVLPVGLSKEERGAVVTLGLPVPPVDPPGFETKRILEPLGLKTGHLDPELAVMRSKDWAIVPVKHLATLQGLKPDMTALQALTNEGIGNTIVITRQTTDPDSLVQLRMFAPAFGIDEDPVTGSAQGPVAAWLAATRLLPGPSDNATRNYVAEQGDAIGRPGRVGVRVEMSGDTIASIAIEGRAVTMMKGSLTIP